MSLVAHIRRYMEVNLLLEHNLKMHQCCPLATVTGGSDLRMLSHKTSQRESREGNKLRKEI